MTHIAAIVLILGLCLPQVLMAGVILQDGEIDRLKETIDTLSVKKENKSRRIVGKLAGGVLGGVLLGLVGGVAGGAISDCSREDPYCKLEYGTPGLLLGYLVGVPIGMNRMDAHDRFTYSLVGSLIGGAASLAVFKMVENETAEKLGPALVVCPLIGSTIMSEFFRKPPEDSRVSIGLQPGPKGRLSAIATLRF